MLILKFPGAENIDFREHLESLAQAFARLSDIYTMPVVINSHPRSRARMELFGLDTTNKICVFMEPFGFFDFITFEKNAFCILADSGTVQEECAIFGVPNVTICDVTERPEKLECGSKMLSGADTKAVVSCMKTVPELNAPWKAPAE